MSIVCMAGKYTAVNSERDGRRLRSAPEQRAAVGYLRPRYLRVSTCQAATKPSAAANKRSSSGVGSDWPGESLRPVDVGGAVTGRAVWLAVYDGGAVGVAGGAVGVAGGAVGVAGGVDTSRLALAVPPVPPIAKVTAPLAIV
jgi:hypothetical protein